MGQGNVHSFSCHRLLRICFIRVILHVTGVLTALSHPDHLPMEVDRDFFPCRLPATRIM
ncbi:hypothetical protein HMPREF0758_2493 [Serratia odorifera DSM 4582]|uniref:Uncharacterized protein n=1 Tax=Serratia odorifera DSM 4582 TaxID=667129 RepID=D4E2U3_SEROD|nr:hypothetical protein HMPREF0758_2493 [Serratia odorifera DSM 4582]